MSSTHNQRSAAGRQHAIVIGASFSGLFTARVLLKHFERVTVLEKDALDFDKPSFRKGQPQSPHQHLLLLKGRELIEQYFPGFNSQLDAHGVGYLDYGGAVTLQLPSGTLPRYPTGIELRPCRRPLIDHLLLRQLAEESRLNFIDQAKVTGLKYERANAAVRGAFYKQLGQGQCLEADLVVDCSGRGSHLPKWLEQLGYEAPPTTQVDAKLGYASRLYNLPDGHDFDAMDIAHEAPNHPYAAGLWPVENGQWLLTLIGMNNVLPPRDEAGFRAFADKLLSPRIAQFIDAAQPASDIECHRGSANIWRQYQRTKLPEGVLALGDAVCAYNPLHGQGISVAASVASALDLWLKKHVDGRTRSTGFLRRAYWIYLQAWSVAVSEDLRWPKVQSENLRLQVLLRFSQQFVDRILRAAQRKPALIKACLEVTNMMRSPLSLLRPQVLWRTFGPSRQHGNLPANLSREKAFFSDIFTDQLRYYQAQWGEQSSSYFGCQKRCRYFVIEGIGYIAFATYRVGFKKVNVVPTNPVCAPENIEMMIESLGQITGYEVLLIGVDAKCKDRLTGQGYGYAQLGREFQVRLADFEVKGKAKKQLRWASNIGKRGFSAIEQAWSDVDAEQVRQISTRWRRSKTFRIRELEMLTRPPVFDDEPGVRKFYCYHHGRLVGFVFFDPFYQDGKVIGYCANILRADLNVRPNGFLDYTLLEAMKVFRAEGVEYVSLGMAPLYGVEQEQGDMALVRKLARLIYRYGNRLYAFKALAYHKQRYRMQETPWYICYRGLSLPSVAYVTARACRVI